MTVVNPKSISGITSITTASGSDDLLTIHTNNGTERLRVDTTQTSITGTTKIVTGIVTTLTATTGIVTTLTTNTLNANSTAKVGTGITLSSDGNVFAVGFTTIGSRAGHDHASDCQLQVFANSQVGVRTGVFGDTQVAIGYTDIARFEIANRTNGGLAIGMDDDSNVSYIRHRDNGGDLAFMTRSGSQDRERLRITAEGAIGIGGSNYGSSGQVIASGGSAAAPSYQYLNRPYFKAGQSSVTTLTHAAYTKVIFDDEQKDTDSAYDPSTGRFTVPSGQDGTYMFMFSVGIDDLNENDMLQIRVHKNGSAVNDGRVLHFGGKNGIVVNCSSAFTMYGLNAGDYIEIFAYHDEGSNQETEQNRCFFEGYKLHVGDP